MKIGIMQPYIFPHIGYYQLINLVDVFVIYDDVNFIKQGWINRNKILLNNDAHFFNIILKGASSFKKINEIELNNNNNKLLLTIKQTYHKSPYFSKIYPIIYNILSYEEINLGKFLSNSIIRICEYLDINTNIVISSEINKNNNLKGYDKVIDICKNLNGDHYINAIGGQQLYFNDIFDQNGLKLNFIKSEDITYNQFNDIFVPHLSIIDVLMFNSPEKIKEMLNNYELI